MGNITQKRQWRDSIIWILIVGTIVTFGGDLIGAYLLPEISEKQDYLYTFMAYFETLTLWGTVLFVIFVFKKNRYIKGYIALNNEGNTFLYLGIGLIVGFLLNIFCALVAWLNGDINLRFMNFNILEFFGLFLAVFVQSSSEEVLCRGFVYQRLLKSYNKSTIAIIFNSIFFAVLHLENDGITMLGLYDLFITGIFFSLIVYYFDSLWMSMGLHTTWNFTQSILLGLPNSGTSFPYSVFRLDTSTVHSSFAYDTGFGLEGTILSASLMTVCCIVLYFLKGNGKNLIVDINTKER